MSRDSLKASLDLWLEFARHAKVRVGSLQSPLKILEAEVLGRALFSGNVKNNKLRPNAFLLSPGAFELSVNRLSCATEDAFVRISKLDALRRSIRATRKGGKPVEIKFYGFAEFLQSDLRQISVDKQKALRTSSDMTLSNPLHAILALEKDQGKDFYLEVADKLLTAAKYVDY